MTNIICKFTGLYLGTMPDFQQLTRPVVTSHPIFNYPLDALPTFIPSSINSTSPTEKLLIILAFCHKVTKLELSAKANSSVFRELDYLDSLTNLTNLPNSDNLSKLEQTKLDNQSKPTPSQVKLLAKINSLYLVTKDLLKRANRLESITLTKMTKNANTFKALDNATPKEVVNQLSLVLDFTFDYLRDNTGSFLDLPANHSEAIKLLKADQSNLDYINPSDINQISKDLSAVSIEWDHVKYEELSNQQASVTDNANEVLDGKMTVSKQGKKAIVNDLTALLTNYNSLVSTCAHSVVLDAKETRQHLTLLRSIQSKQSQIVSTLESFNREIESANYVKNNIILKTYKDMTKVNKDKAINALDKVATKTSKSSDMASRLAALMNRNK